MYLFEKCLYVFKFFEETSNDQELANAAAILVAATFE